MKLIYLAYFSDSVTFISFLKSFLESYLAVEILADFCDCFSYLSANLCNVLWLACEVYLEFRVVEFA